MDGLMHWQCVTAFEPSLGVQARHHSPVAVQSVEPASAESRSRAGPELVLTGTTRGRLGVARLAGAVSASHGGHGPVP